MYKRDFPLDVATVFSMIKSSVCFLYTSKLPESLPFQKEKSAATFQEVVFSHRKSGLGKR